MLSVKTVGGAAFTIFTAKAAKFHNEGEQFRYRHLNVKLDAWPSDAKGIFAELTGAAPITSATKHLLANPAAFDKVMSREQATVPNDSLEGEGETWLEPTRDPKQPRLAAKPWKALQQQQQQQHQQLQQSSIKGSVEKNRLGPTGLRRCLGWTGME